MTNIDDTLLQISLKRRKFSRSVLVLDARFEPVRVVNMEQGFVLLYTERGVSILDSERELHGVQSVFSVPWIIQLTSATPKKARMASPRFSRKNVYLRDHYQCQYCGYGNSQTLLTLDHLIPLSRGGKTSWTNVVTACRQCNQKKGARYIEEVGMRLFTEPVKPTFTFGLVFLLRYGITENNIPPEWVPYINLNLLKSLEQPETQAMALKLGA